MKNILVKKFFGASGIQLFSKLITLLAGIFYARALGAENYGLYGYYMSLIAIFAIPVVSGLPNLIIRELTYYKSENDGGKFHGIIVWSTIYIFGMSLISFFLLCFLAKNNYVARDIGYLLIPLGLIILFKGYTTQQTAIINSCKKPVLSQIPIQIFVPLITLILVLSLVIMGFEANAGLILKSTLFAFVLSLLFSLVISYKSVRKLKIKKRDISFSTKALSKSLFPLSIMAIISTLNIEVASVFIAELSDTKEVAYFKVAMQAVSIMIIGLNSINTILMPEVATLYKLGEMDSLQAVIKKAVRLNSLFAMPVILVLTFFGRDLIVIFFGDEYEQAYIVMMILCIGQFVNVLSGSVGLILNMTRNERSALVSSIIALIINIVTLYTLTPIYGAIGAAISLAISIVAINAINSYQVIKKLELKAYLH